MITFTKEQLIARINQVTAINKYRIGMDPNADGLAMDNELFAISLASLEAEPVAYMYKDRLHADARFSLHTRFGNWSQEDINEYEITEIPLYTATPAPVFPRDLEEIIFTIVNAMADEKLRNDESELFSLAKKYIEHATSKLGAAMLQGAEPVTTAYKLPDEFDFDRFNDVVWLEAVASNPHMHSPTTSTIAMVALELNRKLSDRNSPVISDGWKLVPVEPTAEMISSGIAAHYERSQIQIHDRTAPGPMECAYVAMLAAAPQQEAKNV